MKNDHIITPLQLKKLIEHHGSDAGLDAIAECMKCDAVFEQEDRELDARYDFDDGAQWLFECMLDSMPGDCPDITPLDLAEGMIAAGFLCREELYARTTLRIDGETFLQLLGITDKPPFAE